MEDAFFCIYTVSGKENIPEGLCAVIGRQPAVIQFLIEKVVVRFHPAGIFNDRWNFTRLSSAESLHPVFLWRYLHHMIKMTVKIAQSAEAGHYGDGKNSMVCVSEQITCIHDSYGIQIV